MTPEKQTHAKGRHPGLMPGNLEEKKMHVFGYQR